MRFCQKRASSGHVLGLWDMGLLVITIVGKLEKGSAFLEWYQALG